MSTTTTPATAATIGQELVGLCRQGKNGDAIERFYSKNIVSVEPVGSEAMPAATTGIEAARGKHHWWTENMTVHSAEVKGPFLADDQFAGYYNYDTTFKPTGKRSTMKEMALYTVKDGEIVREEFYYAPNAD